MSFPASTADSLYENPFVPLIKPLPQLENVTLTWNELKYEQTLDYNKAIIEKNHAVASFHEIDNSTECAKWCSCNEDALKEAHDKIFEAHIKLKAEMTRLEWISVETAICNAFYAFMQKTQNLPQTRQEVIEAAPSLDYNFNPEPRMHVLNYWNHALDSI